MSKRLLITAAAAALLAGCSLASMFEKPPAEIPAAFKEETSAAEGTWKKAESQEAADRGQWWKVFGDPRLDVLEAQAEAGNQPLKAYAARVEQARAAVRANAADLLPNISLGANGSRTKAAGASPSTLYTAQAAASYEPDLFGRIRNAEKAFFFEAEATEADYRSLLLSLQADVAQNYFLLRAIDSERLLLRGTVEIRAQEAEIMKKRYAAGDVGAEDDANAQSDLAAARAELLGLDRQRAALEHALAILVGRAPSGFSLPMTPLAGTPPAVPSGLPSAVLERRPDISAAIAGMEAANARIGAARAAYFPNLLLTASAGAESSALNNLFHWSSRAWALGQVGALALTLPIFDNGRRSAQLDSARAAYDEAVANYRQRVLVAFKETEDSLSDQRLLAEQWEQAKKAAAQASRATYLAQKRYQLGDVDYFEVVTAQRVSLAAERAAVQVHGQRFVAAISLIRALGGGWGDSKGSNAAVQDAPPPAAPEKMRLNP
jgi:multidrug efflux system outer membrane protein